MAELNLVHGSPIRLIWKRGSVCRDYLNVALSAGELVIRLRARVRRVSRANPESLYLEGVCEWKMRLTSTAVVISTLSLTCACAPAAVQGDDPTALAALQLDSAFRISVRPAEGRC